MYRTLMCALLASSLALRAEPVAVRYTEGLVHGFLILRAANDRILADGELDQFAQGDRVTSKLVFRFRDGSYQEETAVFSQSSTFRLLSDHLIQKGASFKHPLDMSIDCMRQQVTVRYMDDGKEKVADEHMDLPPDLANGLISILLKNVQATQSALTLSMVAATPKPRLVKLQITRTGEDAFTHGRISHKASHFLLKVELGGVTGVVAPLVGKEPPDNHVWILGGDAPAFLKSQSPLYAEGPMVRIELASPAWPHAAAPKAKR